jgi:hypothetical protein
MPKGRGKGKKGKKRGMKLDDLLDLAQEKVQEKLDNREKFTDVSYLNYRKFWLHRYKFVYFLACFGMRSDLRDSSFTILFRESSPGD